MQLKTLQAMFAEGIKKGSFDTAFLSLVALNHDLWPAQRAQIYHNNARITLVKTLQAIYPILARLLGSEYFEKLADLYIKQWPYTAKILNDYGHAMAALIADFTPLKDFIYMKDVARLEWLIHRATIADNATGFDLKRFQNLSAEQHAKLIFKLNPSLFYIESDFPIDRIWQINQPDMIEVPILDLNQEQGLIALLIVKQDEAVIFCRLNSNEREFIKVLLLNKNLEAMLDDSALSSESVLQLLPQFIQQRYIVGFQLGAPALASKRSLQ